MGGYIPNLSAEVLSTRTGASNAFVVAYLLGTKEDTLDANFFHDYRTAEDIGFFDDYDTYKLHLLIRLRGHLLKNMMNMPTDAHLRLKEYVYGRDVDSLATLAIFVYDDAKTYNDITDYLVALNIEIEELAPRVLDKWEIMQPALVSKLFQFVDPTNWNDIVEEALYYKTRIKDFCYSRYVAYHREMGVGRNSLLFNDDNLYKTLMKATGEKHRYKDLDKTLWEKVYLKLTEPIESISSDKECAVTEQVTESLENKVAVEETEELEDTNVVEKENDIKHEENTEDDTKKEEEDNMSWKSTIEPLPLDFNTTIERKTVTKKENGDTFGRLPLIDKTEGLLGYDTSKEIVFYVDCDNVDVLSMLEFFMQLSKEGDVSNYHVKLFIDDMTAYGWKYLITGVLQGMKIEIIQTERIRSEKSAVDVVLTGHFIKDSLTNEKAGRIVVSSDSDYFGLATMGYDFGVVYQDDYVSTRYIQKLYKMGIRHKDITDFKPDRLDTNYKTEILRVLVAQVLENTPVSSWSDTAMVDDFVTKQLSKMDAKDIFSDLNIHSSVIEKWVSSAKVVNVNGKFCVVIEEG